MLVGTTALRSQLPHVRVLAEGLRRFAPEVTLCVLVADAPGPVALPAHTRQVDPLELMPAAEWAHRRAIYEARALTGSLVGLLLEHLLGQDAAALHADPGTLVLGDLTTTLAEVAAHPITFTPRAGWPSPVDHELNLRGPFTSGWVGATRAGLPFLRWWGERVRRDCALRPDIGRHYEESSLTQAADFFDAHVLAKPEAPTTVLGLAGQELAWDGDRLRVNDVHPPAVVLGGTFDPAHPAGVPEALEWGLVPSREPAFRQLVATYAQRLGAHADADPAPYGWAATGSGLRLDATMRRLYAEARVMARRSEKADHARSGHRLSAVGRRSRSARRASKGHRVDALAHSSLVSASA